MTGIPSRSRCAVALTRLRRASVLASINVDRISPVLTGALAALAVPGARGLLTGAIVALVLAVSLRSTPAGARLRAWCDRSRRHDHTSQRVRASFAAAGHSNNLRIATADAGAGTVVTVASPLGSSDASLAAHAPALASDLRAWRVTTLPEARHGRTRFLVQMTDPLAQTVDRSWAPAEFPIWSARCPVPVGLREDGSTATLSMWCQTTLVGGSPGSGKSVFGWLPLLAACLDPTAIVVVIDLKPYGIETAPVAARADYVAHTGFDARHVLSRVWLLILRRNRALRDQGREKVPTDDPDTFPPVVVFIDEAAELSMTPEGTDALATLQRIVAMGRASVVSVVLLTQKPDAQTVPTSLRDLFAQRVAFRVGNRAQAETILGVAGDGIRPWEIATDSPGVGYLLGSTGETVRFRSSLLDRETIRALADRATSSRQAWTCERPLESWTLPDHGEESTTPQTPAPATGRRRRRRT